MSIRGVAWKTPPAVVLLFLPWACECALVRTETASVWEMCGRGDLEAYPGSARVGGELPGLVAILSLCCGWGGNMVTFFIPWVG